MDALKFFKEWNRMCSSSNECAKCPFNGQKCDLSGIAAKMGNVSPRINVPIAATSFGCRRWSDGD